jgi:hypothetical protein
MCFSVNYNPAMKFDPRIAEAQIALNRSSSTEMPLLAWQALEAGLDGPAIRRLAALEFPTFFQVEEVLPNAMREMHLVKLTKKDAAIRLARIRAQEILSLQLDPLLHLRDFEHLWIEAEYCRELADYGNLADDVYVARSGGEVDSETREWVLNRIQKLASIQI